MICDNTTTLLVKWQGCGIFVLIITIIALFITYEEYLRYIML